MEVAVAYFEAVAHQLLGESEEGLGRPQSQCRGAVLPVSVPLLHYTHVTVAGL
jgi:hypothetical protein